MSLTAAGESAEEPGNSESFAGGIDRSGLATPNSGGCSEELVFDRWSRIVSSEFWEGVPRRVETTFQPNRRRFKTAADAAPDQPADEPLANTLKWTTASEVENFGFDIYRGLSEDGPFEKITTEPLSGAGRRTSRSTMSMSMNPSIPARTITTTSRASPSAASERSSARSSDRPQKGRSTPARIDFRRIRVGRGFRDFRGCGRLAACCASPIAAVNCRHSLFRVSHTTVFPPSLNYVDSAFCAVIVQLRVRQW